MPGCLKEIRQDKVFCAYHWNMIDWDFRDAIVESWSDPPSNSWFRMIDSATASIQMKGKKGD